MNRWIAAFPLVGGLLGQSLAQAPVAPAAPVVAEPCAECAAGFDFKNVPRVRPATRVGAFPILPTGPGAYSAYDRLAGESREAAPKYPYPPFVLSTLSFFDADWRFVDDPKYSPDALEKLKRIRVGEDWLLSTGGQAWFRFANELNARVAHRNDEYALYRVRPYLDVWYQDKFRFFIEGIFADSAWQNLPPRGNDVDRADFQNLFLEAKLFEYDGAPVQARVGRQEIALGSQRLVSSPDWANARRTFDGARLMRTGEKWDYDLFWVRPVVQNASRLNSGDNNQNFAGSWLTYRPKKGTSLDFYYLMLDNTNRTTQLGVARSPYTLHTFGSRFAGDVDGRFLWDVEGAMQLGRNRKEDVVAGMFSAGAGYHWKETAWNPVLWLNYDYASGDGDPGRGQYNTFDQLFPFGHYYFGWLDLVGRQNIHDLNANLYLYPSKWVTVWMQAHHFALDQSRDALYNAAGAAIRRDATGASGKNVGDELDLILNFHLTRRADLLTGYSYLFAGDFLRKTNGASNKTADASFVYLSYSYRW